MPDQQLPVTVVTNEDGSKVAYPRFQWNLDREQAATDLAEGVLSLTQIAGRANTTTYTLAAWREHPEFKAKVVERQKVFAEAVMGFGLARKESRIAHLQDRHDRLRTIVEKRGQHFAEQLPEVPGGETGLVYPHVTAHGTDYMVDTKTAALMGDVEKQVAIEVGQWNEGQAPGVAVQIVVPASAPPVSQLPTITIGTGRLT